ncbi:hypothetical protein QFC22_005707 [Naganishia vaughanmartiniae]|uniref:Uncharacterized protein n=1 Tax=Naganishia vaughanmartiniae TaxID=1424756 RepID=A0ACC2WSU4_9TREE|nr:hypothetical protein QFC22_005707 [Naganishia vaughanmartiniae]
MAPSSTRPTKTVQPAPVKLDPKAKAAKAKAHMQQRMKSNALRRKKHDDELGKLQARVDAFVSGLKSSHFTEPTPIQALSIPATIKGQDIQGSARTGSGKTLAFLIPTLERLYRERWGPQDGLGALILSPTRELAVQTFETLRGLGRFHTFSAGMVIGGKPLEDERTRMSRMNIIVATPGRILQHFDSTVGLETSGVKVLVLDEADRLLDMGFLPAMKAIVAHMSDSHDRQTMLFSATYSEQLAQLAKLSLKNPLYINVNRPGEEGVMPAGLTQMYAVVPLERKLDALWGFIKGHLQMKGVVFVSSCKQVRFIFETFRKLHPGLSLLHLHGKQKQTARLDIFQRFSAAKHALLICTDIASRGLDFPAVDWVIQLDCPEDVDMYIHRVGRTARYQSEGKGLCFLLPSEEDGMKARWEEKGIKVDKKKIPESKLGQLSQQMQAFAFRDPEIKYLGQRAFISYLKSIHIQKDKSVFKLSEMPIEAYAASLGLPGAPQIKFIMNAKSQKNQMRAGQKADVEVDGGVVVNAAQEEETETRLAEGVPEQEVGDSDEDEEDVEESGSEEEEEESVSDDASGSGEESDASESDTRDAAQTSKDKVRSTDLAKPVSEPHHTLLLARQVITKRDRMMARKNQDILSEHYRKLVRDDDEGQGEEDDFMTVTRNVDPLADVPADSLVASLEDAREASPSAVPAMDLDSAQSKRKAKLAHSKKEQVRKGRPGDKKYFDEEGRLREVYAGEEEFAAAGAAEGQREEYLRREREVMAREDVVDRQVAREKKQEKKRKRKLAEREAELAELAEKEGGGAGAVLGGYSDEESAGGQYDSASDGGAYSDDDNEQEDGPSVSGKRAKIAGQRAGKPSLDEEEDEEALALRLLTGGR